MPPARPLTYDRSGVCGAMNAAGSLVAACLAAVALAGASHGTPTWFNGRAPTAQAWAMADLLRRADEKGLRAADYDAAEWPARLDAAGRSDDAVMRASVDAAFTSAARRYLHDVGWGRVEPRRVGFDLSLRDDGADESALREIARADDLARAVAALEPPFAGYQRTLAALRDYRVLASEDTAESLPVPRRPIQRGDRYPGLRRLADLLRRVGDLTTAEVDEGVYGAEVAAAVARFQRRHGLEPHGRLDRTTAARLDVPLARRVRQLELTAERWRWLPRTFRSAPVVVNIPEFRLHVGRAGDHWSMRVVVGRAYRTQTPVFASEITSVVFRPTWNVPRSIARDEIAPQVARDPGYLSRHGYELVDAHADLVAAPADPRDTAALIRSGAVRLRQRPAPTNTLGLVKFVFPNAHDVYMHGTPSTELFARSRRDFSHGCIRVEDPLRLAAWVLRDEPGWTLERIARAMEESTTRVIRLRNSTPVLIVYGTALVAEDGTVSFYDDVYGYDAELERALDDGA
jgi:L,D-transpeptidase YcbB